MARRERPAKGLIGEGSPLMELPVVTTCACALFKGFGRVADLVRAKGEGVEVCFFACFTPKALESGEEIGGPPRGGAGPFGLPRLG